MTFLTFGLSDPADTIRIRADLATFTQIEYRVTSMLDWIPVIAATHIVDIQQEFGLQQA
ncbi:MAG: hypothetical protein HHJ09_06260 [Glaciimonas sp.]|nr:hypothetical protein [Glaciimonas sp.]